ncbi:procathepsin L-like [Chiloscyllium plagiosum]|uniref:procathepsin L-like n=1 Tax=Chiloscyllium plagiosum TaxID=36176 RepID=UPI001CB7D2CD|nr:procathepsin L-like [Chiloscyllium plagiosum]
MKLTLILGCVVVSTLAAASGHTFDSTLDEDWKNWKSKHGKQYTEDEENSRRMIWEDNMRFIEQHNLEYSMGKHTFTVGMNQFGDMTNKEFNEIMNGFRPVDADNANEVDEFDDDINDEESNEDENNDKLTIDWRKKGFVTPVKNQGHCGSCWAFSATGAIEGQWFERHKQLISLSEQNLVDCSGQYGAHGCFGGWMSQAFEYVINNHGINSAADYPYLASDQACKFMPNKTAATIRHYAFVIGREKYLAKAVERIGPVSVAVDANQRDFQLYHSGIYRSEKCSRHLPNHAMLVVGFGGKNRQKYWLVKNSWGTDWGDEGYIKIAKDAQDMCGIARFAVYPIV